MPFALLPLKAGFWIWRAFCLIVAACLLRAARVNWKVVGLGLASPAAWYDFANGQNGTLTGTILLVALLSARRRPIMAGVCAGVLTIKPHLGLPIVIAAIRLRGWKLIGCASLIALGLAAVASILWGKEAWVWFFGTAQHDEWAWTAQSFKTAFPGAGTTTYFMARSFGFSDFEASIAQAVSAVLALALIWRLWKPGFMAELPCVIITVCLNVWVVPHGYMYDLVAFSTAMAFLMVGLTGWACFAAALLWLMAGYTGVIAIVATHMLLFPLCAAAGAYLAWHVRHEPALR
ncbi:glycosyltransferase family 87 protein [Acidocella sp.]|uniref:glycosyltransferase family 87 protein n=1 Tax=Acidocella sp. TaxID=50710 RepID=UPI003D07D605